MKSNKLIISVLGVVLIVLGAYIYQMNEKKESVNVETSNVNENNTFEEKSEMVNVDQDTGYRFNSAGAIDFEIIFVNPRRDDENYWRFQVYMDTHSVDLDSIPFEDLVYFEDDIGRKIDSDIELITEGYGHHISQYVKLPKKIDGKDTILRDYEEFKLIFKDIEGVSKTEFSWNMKGYPEIFN